MSLDAHKELVRRYYRAIDRGEYAVVDNFYAPGYIDHDAPEGTATDLGGIKRANAAFRTAFPDSVTVIEDMIAENDRVVVRWTGTGTRTGPLFGMLPTGKRVSVRGIDIFRFRDGRVIEHWGSDYAGALMQQLGS